MNITKVFHYWRLEHIPEKARLKVALFLLIIYLLTITLAIPIYEEGSLLIKFDYYDNNSSAIIDCYQSESGLHILELANADDSYIVKGKIYRKSCSYLMATADSTDWEIKALSSWMVSMNVEAETWLPEATGLLKITVLIILVFSVIPIAILFHLFGKKILRF